MKEIGSEFEETNYKTSTFDKTQLIRKNDSYMLTLSGRVAINLVLDDINKKVKSVYFPSYYCDSMINPFLERNIKIHFYDVIFIEGRIQYIIDFDKNIDVFFAMSYFGFSETLMEEEILKFHKRDVIVVEDITHRLLMESIYSANCDYAIGSVRKWGPVISGGIVIKRGKQFNDINLKNPDFKSMKLKSEAMSEKKEYLIHSKLMKDSQKKNFIKKFTEFNQYIKNNCKNYKIDQISERIVEKIDKEYIRKKRVENVKVLLGELASIQEVYPMFNTVDLSNDSPLFLPIFIKNGERDKLRDFLIENGIYCPIHWPNKMNSLITSNSKNLYNNTISLICDQRYSKKDMLYIANCIKKYVQ